MKQDYERISNFEGHQGMMRCKTVLEGWRSHARYKSLMRQSQELFLQNLVINRYAGLLRGWQKFSHRRQEMARLLKQYRGVKK